MFRLLFFVACFPWSCGALLCHYSCKECSLLDENYCTSCDSSNKRSLNNNKCDCNSGYGDSGVAKCSKCSSTCLTCSPTSYSECLSCDASKDKVLTSGSCFCKDRYYQNPGGNCVACHYSCLTCTKSTSKTCLSCASSDYRTLDTNVCDCNSGYQDNNDSVCEKTCHFSCLTCSSNTSTSCLTCDSGNKRTLNAGKCNCDENFYEKSVSLCDDCHPTCQTCSSPMNTACISCSVADFRTFSSGQCKCNTHYYDSGAKICQSCHYSCLNCSSNTDITCLTCDAADLRTIVTNQCVCNQNYYDNGVGKCEACHFSCLSCLDATKTDCLTCSSDIKRIYADVSSTCPCIIRYYENNIGQCAECNYTCLTCTSSDQNSCLTCLEVDHRTFKSIDSSCPCDIGFVDKETQQCSLISCHPSCYSCSNTDSVSCLGCLSSDNRVYSPDTNECQCSDGYVEDGKSLCVSKNLGCHPSCLTCSLDLACETCDEAEFRKFNDNTLICNCLERYFDTEKSKCERNFYYKSFSEACHFSCLTCLNESIEGCILCSGSDFRNDKTLGQCLCDDGFFDTNAQICAACHRSCLSCSGSSTKCTTCSASDHRIFKVLSSECICDARYYDDGITSQCQECDYSCLTCTSIQCLSCSEEDKRIWVVDKQECQCMNRYFDELSSICTACHYSCLECNSQNKDKCLSCDTQSYRSLESGSNQPTHCLCDKGYYEVLWQEVCQKCHISCVTCDGPKKDNCLTCNEEGFIILTESQCECKDSYFENNLGFCLECNQTCLTCKISEEQCSTCDSLQLNRVLIAQKCTCQSRFYEDQLSPVCSKCHFTCLTCSNSQFDSCQSCDEINDFRTLVSGNTCQCDSGYYPIDNLSLCSVCHLSCKSCSDQLPTSCITCDEINDFRTKLGGSCTCQDHYYARANQKRCDSCHSSCLTCDGNERNNCQTCEEDQFRIYELDESTCRCLNGFYENNLFSCEPCHYSCTMCIGGLPNECTECNDSLTFRTLESNKCQCPQQAYFDEDTQQICQLCHVTCLTCDGGLLNNCLTCKNTLYKSVDNQCKCSSRQYYIDMPQPTCLDCHSTCESCSGSLMDECLSCSSVTFHQRSLRNNFCVCNEGYFQQESNLQCQMCYYRCKTCDGSKLDGQLTCLTCDGLLNRYFANQTCVCQSQYFDDETSGQCQSCHPQCFNCSGGSKFQCLSCQDLSVAFRTLNSQECKCIEGFYNLDDQPNCSPNCPIGYYPFEPSRECRNCHRICASCNGETPFDCQTCQYAELLNPEITQSIQTLQYVSNQLDTSGQVRLYKCQDGFVSVNDAPQNTKLRWQLMTKSGFNIQEQDLLFQNPSLFTVPKFKAIAGADHLLKFSAWKADIEQLKSTSSIQLFYQTQGFSIQIIGGDRFIGLRGQVNLTSVIYELDVQENPVMNLEPYLIEWSCSNINTNSQCTNIVGDPLSFNQSQLEQNYQAKDFTPYNSYEFKLQVTNSDSTKSTQVVIQIFEEDIPQLTIKLSPSLLSQKVNINQDIYLEYVVSALNNPDQLYYSANLFYNGEIVDTVTFQYTKIKFRIMDYYSNFSEKDGNIFTFQGSVFNPKFSIPSRSTVKLMLNIPPEHCQLTATPTSGIEISQKFQLTLSNCFDYEQPLAYRFSFYQNMDQLNDDILKGQPVQAIPVTDFQSAPQFSMILVSLDNQKSIYKTVIIILVKNDVIILAEIIDSLGGIANTTTTIQLSRQNVLNGKDLQNLVSNAPTIEEKIQTMQIVSMRIAEIIDNKAITDLKIMIFSQVEVLEVKQLSIFQQNQIQQTKAFMVKGADLQHQITAQKAGEQIQLIEDNMDKLLQSQTETLLKMEKSGSNPALQQLKEQNYIQVYRMTQQLSGLLEKNEQDIQTALESSSTAQYSRSADWMILQNNNKRFLSTVSKTTDILLIGKLPNLPSSIIVNDGFKLQTKFVTKKGLITTMNVDLFHKYQDVNVFSPEDLDPSASEEDPVYQFYTFRLIQYQYNPKRTEQSYPYQEQLTQLIDLQIKQQSTDHFNLDEDKSQKTQNIDNMVQVKFARIKEILKGRIITQAKQEELVTTNQTNVCISQKDGSWVNTQCITTVADENTISCGCEEWSVYSVVDDTKGLFLNGQQNIFDKNSLEAVYTFYWYKVALFYIFIFVLVFFFTIGLWGYFKDKTSGTKIYPFQFVESPQYNQATGLNKIEIKDLVVIEDIPLQAITSGKVLKMKSGVTELSQFNSQNISFGRDQLQVILKAEENKEGFNDLVGVEDLPLPLGPPGKILRMKSDDSSQVYSQKNKQSHSDQFQMISKAVSPNLGGERRKWIQKNPQSEKQENKLQERQAFKEFLIENLPITNNIYIYDKTLSRPLRACLNFTGFFLSLGITVYFGKKLSLLRTSLIIVLSSLLNSIFRCIIIKTLRAGSKLWNVLGCLFIFSINGVIIYITISVIATTSTEEEANEWAIQYVLYLFFTIGIYQIIEVWLKYKLENYVLNGFAGQIVRCLLVPCLKQRE